MNKTKLKRFLKNPMHRNYNQSTLRWKNMMRKKYKKIWRKDEFKGTNNEEGC